MAIVKALLASAALSVADIMADQLAHFFGAEVAGEGMIAGVIGAVPCGRDALLRSLVVKDSHRGQGIGSRLVVAAEKHALDLGARQIFLLTMTAQGFFRQRGYGTISRKMAPESVRSTEEFIHLCPVSSVLMCKPLVSG
jgi:amino-acid N-acetyltransferase